MKKRPEWKLDVEGFLSFFYEIFLDCDQTHILLFTSQFTG